MNIDRLVAKGDERRRIRREVETIRWTRLTGAIAILALVVSIIALYVATQHP